MPGAVLETMNALSIVTQGLPVGTNLALLHFLWMLISGALLPSRGALFPALQAVGLQPAAVRRAWAAFRYGSWQIAIVMSIWRQHIEAKPHWQVHQYEGYVPKAVDTTAYWRPTLKGHQGKHYHPQAEKALPAVVLGMVGRVGSVNGQRVAVLTDLVRADPQDPSESALEANLLAQVNQTLLGDEMPVFDAGFKVRALQAADFPRYLVRLAKNFTARRNTLPEYKGMGRRPEFGERGRPLARMRKGKTIAASPPDRVESWTENGMSFRAEIWEARVLPDVKVSPHAQTVQVVAVYDPRFTTPWLLACPLKLSPRALRGLYRDRWPIEQVPLAAKQMLGAARQLVFAPESVQRLPELTLFVGSMLSYLAATLPAAPTGFWDRNPKPTPGRLRRLLERTPFPLSYPLPARLRKKASVFEHLPMGIFGHRRKKQAASP